MLGHYDNDFPLALGIFTSDLLRLRVTYFKYTCDARIRIKMRRNLNETTITGIYSMYAIHSASPTAFRN